MAGQRARRQAEGGQHAGTFVLGFAISGVSGRFSAGSRDSRARRIALPAVELPGHHRLTAHLDAAVDWDAEFRADLEDLVAVIEAARRRID